MVSLRELKQRLPDPPVLPVVAPVQHDETLPLPGFRVHQGVLAAANLLFNGGNHTVVFSPSRAPISNVSNTGVDEQSISLINGRATMNLQRPMSPDPAGGDGGLLRVFSRQGAVED